ncbi:MAG: cell division protein FtsZ [Hyphomicrobiales bacterium]|nr:cell division protein FtsZ [Hyphomicrobiales bacterium]MBV9432481.1 cell division protein FtsZ [Hyphomicrobiales bacterium]
MTINLKAPDIRELKPRITVFGVGGAGGNAVNNMIESGLQGVEFVVMNTDAQALLMSKAERVIQAGLVVTQGLGAGSHPEVGRAAAEEVMEEIRDHLVGAHMTFVTAGMGGGTGTGAAPIVAKVAREMGILTVGVVTKPFQFEGQRRMRVAEQGIAELQQSVDTLIVIPNQNLFRVANEKTTFADAFAMADQVLYSGVACITDLMVKEGLINLDFADVRAVMREMGKAMMGTGESSGDKRALQAAEAAIANPLLDETSMRGARGLLISISGGNDMTLYEVDEAATRIREEVDQDANIIVGATFDQALEGVVRVSVVATGIDQIANVIAQTETVLPPSAVQRISAATERLRQEVRSTAADPAPVTVPVVQSALAVEAELPFAANPETVAASRFNEPLPEDTRPGPEMAEAFIPPQPERPVVRAPRMPRVEDLPLPGQNQLRAAKGLTRPVQPVEAKRMTLLQRLAAVGLGRREDAEEEVPASSPAHSQPAAQPSVPRQIAPPSPAGSAASPSGRRVPAPPAPRPPHGLDQHGRPLQQRTFEDDQLEIPAFLRRQSN